MIKAEERTIALIVPRRSSDENTFAVVEAAVDRDFADESANNVSALFDAIRLAVSGWFHSTERGQSVIRSTNNDFNVDDLAEWAGRRNARSVLALLGDLVDVHRHVLGFDRPFLGIR